MKKIVRSLALEGLYSLTCTNAICKEIPSKGCLEADSFKSIYCSWCMYVQFIGCSSAVCVYF